MSNPGDTARKNTSGITRRDFIKVSGLTLVGVCVAGYSTGCVSNLGLGYLLVDMKKCQGCMSCMLACSLVHHGEENLSFSRIQILQDPQGSFPDDVVISQCRQCVEPACVASCPVSALKADPEHRNVVMVDEEMCIGCKSCVNACPHTPGKAIWNFIDNHSQKCDMCEKTPYWDGSGGLFGKKACVEICPLSAIIFTTQTPIQEGDSGYCVNLRGEEWARLGFSTED